MVVLAGSQHDLRLNSLNGNPPASLDYRWTLTNGGEFVQLDQNNSPSASLSVGFGVPRITRSVLTATVTATDKFGEVELPNAQIEIISVPAALGVRIGAFRSSCSASLIRADGDFYVLTAAHCVSKLTDDGTGRPIMQIAQMAGALIGGQEYATSLVGFDIGADIALLSVSNADETIRQLPIFPLRSPSNGDSVRAIGYPQVYSDSSSTALIVTESEISEIESEASSGKCPWGLLHRHDDDTIRRDRIDRPSGAACTHVIINIEPDFTDSGNSGGPIVDDDGYIVGIVSSSSSDDPEGDSKFVPYTLATFFTFTDDGLTSLRWYLDGNRQCYENYFNKNPTDDELEKRGYQMDDCVDADIVFTQDLTRVRNVDASSTSVAGVIDSGRTIVANLTPNFPAWAIALLSIVGTLTLVVLSAWLYSLLLKNKEAKEIDTD